MNTKTILKFNSTKSVRPFARLALAILAVGAFGNSVQAQVVWLNEGFTTYNSATPPVLDITSSPNLINAGAFNLYTTVINDGGNVARYNKTSTTTGSQIMFGFSPNTGTLAPRTSGYVSFKIKQNNNVINVANNTFDVGIGNIDTANSTASAIARLIGVSFKPTATGADVIVYRADGLSSSTVSTTSYATGSVPFSAAFSTVRIWFNDSDSAPMPYTDPSGGAQTLGVNSFVVYLGTTLITPSASGTALAAAATGASLSFGKIGFNSASSQTIDFSIDDVFAADSVPSGSIITSATTATAQAGYPFTYIIAPYGVTTPVFSTSTLPGGLSLNTATGVISGTISTAATQGLNNITLTATGTGGPATVTLGLTITPAATVVPSITSATAASGNVTKAFSYLITTATTSPSSTPTSYALTGTLPNGLVLNTATGAITGTPTAAGTAIVSITATNPVGPSTAQTLTITISAAPSYTWTNAGSVWTTGSSWSGGVAPSNSSTLDTATFAAQGTGATSVNVGTGQSIRGISFSVGAYAYTWTGTGGITVGSAGGISNSSAAIQTFGNKVINDGGNPTWTSSVAGGGMVFNGGIDLNSSGATPRLLTFAGAGNATVSGVIANGASVPVGAVTVTATGTTILSGANTYDGLTTMNAATGTLTLSGNNSGAAGGVTLTTGTLNINNANALGTGAVTLTAGTINNTSGAAIVNAGNNAVTWAGDLTYGTAGSTSSSSNLNLGTGIVTASTSRAITFAGTGTTLTIGSVNITSTSSGRTITATGPGNTLNMGGLTLSASTTGAVTAKLAGTANIGVTGPIVNGTAFAHGVEVLATGTTTFSGVNTYTGLTTISAGTLILSGANSSSGYKIMGNAADISPILRINAVNALSASANLAGGTPSNRTGTLEFATSGNYTLNQFTGDNIRFSNSSGSATTLTFTGAANVLSTGGGRTFYNQSANLTITFNGQIDIWGDADGKCEISAIGPVVISGRVVNSSSFVRSFEKSDVGNLTMSGVNSYNGTTTVSKGTLSIPTGGSLTGCGNTVVGNLSTVSSANAASLNLAGAAGVVQVGQNGFVRGYTSGSATTLGTITSLQVQNAGTVEVALGSPWTTGGTIDFATGSKVSVTGTPITGNTYTMMTASGNITGSPILVGATGWALRVDGANLLLEEIDIYNIGVGVTTTFSDIITGTAPLVKKGLGAAIITGDNTFSGGTILQAGKLEVGHANGLGTGAVTLTSGTLKSTVNLDLGKLVESTTTLSTGFQEVYGGASSRVKYSGKTTTINGPVTLDVGTGTTMTMGTLIGNSSAGSLVTKIGAGTVKLMGESTKLDNTGMALNGNASSVLGGWRIEGGTVWFAPSANNGGGNGPIILAGGTGTVTAKFSKLQNSNATYTAFVVPSDLTVESSGLIQFDPDPLTLLGQNELGFNNLSIGANTLEVATATTPSASVVGQGLPSVNFQSATLTGSATLSNPESLDLNLQAVSGAGGFTKIGSGTLYLSEQPNQAAAFAGSLVSGGLVSINVEYAGGGYAVPPAAAPAVRVVPVNGGPGSGALATATIGSNGRVSFITVTAPGSGYTSLPRIEIDAPPTVATENSYTGATTVQVGKLNLSGSYRTSVTVESGAALELDWLAPAQAECSVDGISPTSNSMTAATAANSYVKNLYLTKSVGGYVPSTTFEFDLPAPVRVDGSGTATGTATYVLAAARAKATVDSNGFISALSIVNGGSGYAVPPSVTIPAPTVPTVVARTSGRITFNSGATLAVNIASPTSASYTLLTADDGIIGTPALETSIPGYALTKSSDGKSLILTDMRTDPTISANPTAGRINYGGTLLSSTLSGGSATGVNGAVVEGNFAWKVPSTSLPVGTSSQIVIFTPNDPTAYRPAEFTVSVTVDKAPLTPVFSGNTSPTYDGTAKSLSATTTPETIVNLTYDGSNTAPTSAGIYEVVATVSDANYEGSASTSLVIGRAAQTITFDSLLPVTYAVGATLNLAATASSGLNVSYASSDTSVATVSGSTVTILKAGSTIITASQAGGVNYNAAVAVPQTLTVNRAAITVTADAKSKTYGQAEPVLTSRVTSGALVGSDVLAGSLSRAPGENVGTYAISSTLANANYNVTFVPANLTIGQAAITVTANGGQSKKANNADPVFIYTITSGALVNGDQLTGALSRASGETVGIYDITLGDLTAGLNYDLTYIKASFEIQANGPTFASAFENASATAVGLDGMPNLLRYAMGANSASAAVVKPVSSLDASNLSITAIVRINDPKVSIVGQSGTSLSAWSTAPIEGVRTTDQTGATVGETERQVFSVPRGGTKTFLRLTATLSN